MKIPDELVLDSLFEIYQMLDHTTIGLVGAAVTAIGMIGRYAPLPLKDGEPLDEKSGKVGEKRCLTKRAVAQQLFKVLSHADSKVKAILLVFHELNCPGGGRDSYCACQFIFRRKRSCV